MTSSSFSILAARARYGLALALFLAASVVGCFNTPKVDVSKPITCTSDRYCPWGYICSQGYCCKSSDGKVCSASDVPDGGSSTGGASPTDAPRQEAGIASGGVGGQDGRAGAGGSAPGDGAQPDQPQGATGGTGNGGVTGGGGMAGAGGVILVPGTGGLGNGGGIASVGGSGGAPGGAGGRTTGNGGSGAGGSGGTGGSISGAGGSVSGTGGAGTGGRGTGGSGTGGTTLSCNGTDKPCNGACIPATSCCGGCSGDTPVCSGGTCVGRPNGDPCTPSTATQCASKVCSDSVCCNVACTGQCEACNSSGNAGTCSPTTAPRTPCTSDGTLCGGSCDGSAAHRAACVYPSISTTCGQPAQCNTSTNMATTAQHCSGLGACIAGDSTSCAPFTCSGTVCATSCPAGQGVCAGTCVNIQSDPAHCGTSCTACPLNSQPKCYNGSCVACTLSGDCPALGYGSGSVCTSNSCRCRPSTSNMLQNPNFDGGLTGWRLDYPTLATAVTDDADSCNYSGSARLFYDLFLMGRVSQAIAVNGGITYYLGYRYKQESGYAGALSCLVFLYSGPPSNNTCTGTQSPDSIIITSGAAPSAGNWASKSGSFTTLSTTRCVDVQCQTNSDQHTWYDQVYLNTTGYY